MRVDYQALPLRANLTSLAGRTDKTHGRQPSACKVESRRSKQTTFNFLTF
jgi:hypothetical protein